jgi:hypothetical protein
LPQYGPPEPGAGGGHRRPRCRLALIVLGLGLLGAGLAGCGDGAEDNNTGTPTPAATATRGPVTIAPGRKSSDLIPDLSALGYRRIQQEADPGALAQGQDGHRALYQKGTTNEAALVYVLLLKDDAAAQGDFPVRSAALKNPPPDFVGGAATYSDATPPNVGDERRGYVTASADSQGFKVWNDIYRFGRVVAIVQVLGPGTNEQLPAREAIAKALQASLK